MTWGAWVDESIRPQAGVYLMAAARVDLGEDLDNIRDQLILVAKPRPRIHWRDIDLQDFRTRRRILSAVADIPALHFVVVADKLDRRQERARRHCLQRLLFELDSAEVTDVLLEARTASLNQRDENAISYFRDRGVVSDKMAISQEGDEAQKARNRGPGIPLGPRSTSNPRRGLAFPHYTP